MIYTAIDTFYLSDEQLKNSPSKKDDISESTEMLLRIYGCDLIQESGILLRLPQAVMATGQVLFHRFYCKKSFARFNVKRFAASCVWLASKLEECPRKARQVLIVFHRMECRRENLPIEHLDIGSKKYMELKNDLNRSERHLLKEMGFICHVEHPHKFISNYLRTLEAPDELRQEAWNLANDSLRTTLCVRFKSEVVACGVVYAAARRFQVPLPENPPWWKTFDADKAGIDEVCRVLAYLYSLPKAQYIHVCKDDGSFTTNKSSEARALKETLANGVASDTNTSKDASKQDAEVSKDSMVKEALDKLKESKKSDDEGKSNLASEEAEVGSGSQQRSSDRMGANGDRSREREKDKSKNRERDRGRDSDREREREKEYERDRDKYKDKRHHSKDKLSGHSERSRHHSSRDRGDYYSSLSSRDKDRHRHHHPYA